MLKNIMSALLFTYLLKRVVRLFVKKSSESAKISQSPIAYFNPVLRAPPAVFLHFDIIQN